MTLQANPTLAAGDVKVAIDDGAPANLATLPAVDADFTKRVKVSLSSDEMNGDNITVIFSDAAGAEWCDVLINIQTAAAQIDDLPTTTEFELRTLLAAEYTVVSDLVTAAAIKTAMEADGGDLSSLMEALVNKAIWTESDGKLEMHNDAGTSQGTIAAQITTDGTYTTRKRALI